MTFLPITCSLSPNTELNDVFVAFKTLCMPWKWIKGDDIDRVEAWFLARYPSYMHRSTNSGRSALYLILQAFGIGKGDEVIVQSLTCVAVPNAVLLVGATPIYADIDTRYNIDPESIISHITKKTKAIIIQNSFGIPAQFEKIRRIAKEHKIFLIEDCAHSLGGKYDTGEMIGSVADASFFSFGRDKIVSSVFGGVGSINKKYKKAVEKFISIHDALEYPNAMWIAQQIFHPIAFSVILPFYGLGIGKLLLFLFQKFSFLSYPVYSEEKQGKRPADFPKKYPNALAKLLNLQLGKLERYNAQRVAASLYYRRLMGQSFDLVENVQGSVYLRFPVLSEKRDEIISKAKSRGVLLGTWYSNILDPKGANFHDLQYEKGSCPKAEKIASSIFNLPTRISLGDAKKVVVCLQS